MAVGVAASQGALILNNSGNGYGALDFNQSGGYTPPDTQGAAGPTVYVETVNQEIAIYTPKATGASVLRSSLNNFLFTVGGLPHASGGSGLSDPVVLYNDRIGRFILGDQDVDSHSHVSRFDLAVSKTSSPATLGVADWNFYSIVTTEGGYDADYPGNMGYNYDATVIVLNMFPATSGAGHVQVLSLANTALASGTLTSYRNDLNDFDDRPTVMHGSAPGDPMWLVTEHGDNLTIDLIKMTNILSTSAMFSYNNLSVTPYSTLANPLNPNGTVITDNIDSRIQKAAAWNGTLVAAHAVGVSGSQDVVQWYALNISGGTPTLIQQGRVSAGNNTYCIFPAIEINASGDIGLTYIKSGTDSSTDYMSMYITGRAAGDPLGTMQTPVLVPAGRGLANYTDFSNPHRAGDLSGMNVDPVDGSFWAANEFANTEASANWGTAVANFIVGQVVASFTGGPTNGVPPLTVTFTNFSAGATNYAWTFGDGNSSTNANPSNVYSNVGVYSVTLLATGPTGASTLIRTNYITVGFPNQLLVFSTLLPNGTFQFAISNVDGSAITTAQQAYMTVYATRDLRLPFTNWALLTNPTVIINGLLQVTDPGAGPSSRRYYRSVQRP
jgi:hypothetical protein